MINPDLSKWFNGKIQDVFLDECTTIQEREKIARNWHCGDREWYVELAKRRNLLPVALIVAALLDTEDPLVILCGRLRTKELADCALIVLKIERQSVGKFLKSVGNYPETVDKTDKTVDKSPKTVDNFVYNFRPTVDNFG